MHHFAITRPRGKFCVHTLFWRLATHKGEPHSPRVRVYLVRWLQPVHQLFLNCLQSILLYSPAATSHPLHLAALPPRRLRFHRLVPAKREDRGCAVKGLRMTTDAICSHRGQVAGGIGLRNLREESVKLA